MKAFKGCINSSCPAYKKIHFKKTDDFCTKCGGPLQFVCADCWTQLDDDSERYCVACISNRKDKMDRNLENAKDIIKGVGTLAVGAVGAVAMVAKNAKQLDGAVKDIAKVAKDVLKK